MKTLVKILIVLVLGAVFYYSYTWYKDIKTERDVAQTLTTFLQRLSDNDYDSAYLMTTVGLKISVSKEELKKRLGPIFDRHTFKSQIKTKSNYAKAYVETTQYGVFDYVSVYEYYGTITFTGNVMGELTAVLAYEDHKWKVHRINITTP